MCWKHRELNRFVAGEYKPVPVALDYPAEHFLHLSVTESEADSVAYTPSAEYGERDRQVRLKFGRYLRKVFPAFSDADIQAHVTAFKSAIAVAEMIAPPGIKSNGRVELEAAGEKKKMTLRRYIEIKDIIGIAFDKDRSEMSPAELLTDFFTPGDWIKDAIAKLGSEYDIWLSINPDTCEVASIAAQMALTAREACTVLAALRHWQLVSDPKGQSPDHFEDAEPLSEAEIDELCERINVEWPE